MYYQDHKLLREFWCPSSNHSSIVKARYFDTRYFGFWDNSTLPPGPVKNIQPVSKDLLIQLVKPLELHNSTLRSQISRFCNNTGVLKVGSIGPHYFLHKLLNIWQDNQCNLSSAGKLTRMTPFVRTRSEKKGCLGWSSMRPVRA